MERSVLALKNNLTNKVWFIIPARKGSKEIPGKNIKLLGKKPLISWTIEEAKKSAAVLGHNFPNSNWYKDSYDLIYLGGSNLYTKKISCNIDKEIELLKAIKKWQQKNFYY